ncbi:MAG: nuclear transport factor 2 family protein [Chromatiales bacterium]|nr:nuclear transport factor 2 family protein [Gammaproteobacteria bacterium]MCP5352861.1 nuclear transport factor 2 family protein [Chromatiales bacterium]
MTHETPDAAETAFYAAFEALDLGAMAAVWDADAVCVHPGGPLLRGHQAVMQSWTEILGNAEPPRIGFDVLQRTVSGDLAVHLVEERIHPKGKSSTHAAAVIATNTYVRRDGGWKLLAHHASLPLMRKQAQRETAQLH